MFLGLRSNVKRDPIRLDKMSVDLSVRLLRVGNLFWTVDHFQKEYFYRAAYNYRYYVFVLNLFIIYLFI